MRTTRGKASLDEALGGDPQLAEQLLRALKHTEREDDLTHGFHTYPAGLHPAAARTLLELSSPTGVLDPFCGGGTVLIEAMRAGVPAFGSDVSPIALMVARERTRLTDEAFRTRVRSAARRIADVAKRNLDLPDEAFVNRVRDWYTKQTVLELEGLRRGIEDADDDIQDVLWFIFSTLLVKVSYRRSDTSAQKVFQERPHGATAILFHKKAREWGRPPP